MNDNTTKLIEQLSQKLGTTTEYLWNVLLKQAHIDATTTLLQVIFILFFGVFLYKTHIKLSKKADDGKYSENFYQKYEELAVLPMFFGAIFFLILFIAAFFSIGDIVNGYFNPEFWALNKILSTFK